MIKHDSPIKSRFSNILDMILTSGLIAKWSNDLEKRPSVKTEQFEEYVYSMQDLGPPAVVIVLFLVGSVVAFIAEVFIYYVRRLSNDKIWVWTEKWICGKRYYFLLKPEHNFIDRIIFRLQARIFRTVEVLFRRAVYLSFFGVYALLALAVFSYLAYILLF